VSGAPTASATQFTGREYAAAELYFNRARFYSPRFQRFLSEDPLGHAGGINLFAYADNRPTLLTDPLGLKPRPGGDGPRIGPAPGPFIGPAPREPCSGGPAPVRYAGGIFDPGAGIGPAGGAAWMPVGRSDRFRRSWRLGWSQLERRCDDRPQPWFHSDGTGPDSWRTVDAFKRFCSGVSPFGGPTAAGPTVGRNRSFGYSNLGALLLRIEATWAGFWLFSAFSRSPF
jgi:RHS repeat-associated protein